MRLIAWAVAWLAVGPQPTEMSESARMVIGAPANALAGPTGHIVVRVDSGGERFRVLVLSNRDESDTVLSVHGPVASLGATWRE